MSLLSLLSINIKYLYLTPSSTSQVTILLDESKVEELTGWLIPTTGRSFAWTNHTRKIQRQISFSFQGTIFTTGL